MGERMTDPRSVRALQLAEDAALAAEKFKAKSPTSADTTALASIALSLSVIAESLSRSADPTD